MKGKYLMFEILDKGLSANKENRKFVKQEFIFKNKEMCEEFFELIQIHTQNEVQASTT